MTKKKHPSKKNRINATNAGPHNEGSASTTEATDSVVTDTVKEQIPDKNNDLGDVELVSVESETSDGTLGGDDEKTNRARIDKLPEHIRAVINQDLTAQPEEEPELRIADVLQKVIVHADAVECQLIGKRAVIARLNENEVIVDLFTIHPKSFNEEDFKPVETSFKDAANNKVSLTRMRFSTGALEAVVFAFNKAMQNKIIQPKLVKRHQ